MQYIKKRDGRVVEFNKNKIVNAILKAFQQVDGDISNYALDKANNIANFIENETEQVLTVEEIQDLVENGLMSTKRKDVARAYIKYRQERSREREWNTKMMDKVAVKLAASDVQNQNANVDEYSFGGRRGEADSVIFKQYALDNLISKMARNNHLNNEIYIHDLDAYILGMHNCLTVPFDDLLATGFNTRQTDVRPANSINTAFQLVAVLFQLQSLQQFGGVSASHLDWTMVPYVRKSFYKHYLDGMRYVESGLFNENLYRKLQLSYPTYNFDSVNFEIDNEGHPYYIASVVKYAGVGLRREVTGVVILNPVNGKSKYYKVKDVPNWVDHVYEADLVIEQVNDWGKYKKGYINSLISQKGVVKTTRGYNYLAMDNDVYLYTGITSVISDESNIGFVLTNMRTKETKFYSVSGAEEYSAMESAKGQVQQMNYTSTFPLLINLNGRPTYLISLKDNANLVKMYAFVDVVDYQKVVVTDSSEGIKKAAENYLNEVGEEVVGENEKKITINNIKEVIIDGNTYYYFNDENNQKYKVSIKVNKNKLPFINNGDTITINYPKEGEVISITDIK